MANPFETQPLAPTPVEPSPIPDFLTAPKPPKKEAKIVTKSGKPRLRQSTKETVKGVMNGAIPITMLGGMVAPVPKVAPQPILKPQSKFSKGFNTAIPKPSKKKADLAAELSGFDPRKVVTEPGMGEKRTLDLPAPMEMTLPTDTERAQSRRRDDTTHEYGMGVLDHLAPDLSEEERHNAKQFIISRLGGYGSGNLETQRDGMGNKLQGTEKSATNAVQEYLALHQMGRHDEIQRTVDDFTLRRNRAHVVKGLNDERVKDPTRTQSFLNEFNAGLERGQEQFENNLGGNYAEKVTKNKDSHPVAKVLSRLWSGAVTGTAQTLQMPADVLLGDLPTLFNAEGDASANDRLGAALNVAAKGLGIAATATGVGQGVKMIGSREILKGTAKIAYELGPVQNPLGDPKILQSNTQKAIRLMNSGTITSEELQKSAEALTKRLSSEDKSLAHLTAREVIRAANEAGSDISVKDALAAAHINVALGKVAKTEDGTHALTKVKFEGRESQGVKVPEEPVAAQVRPVEAPAVKVAPKIKTEPTISGRESKLNWGDNSEMPPHIEGAKQKFQKVIDTHWGEMKASAETARQINALTKEAGDVGLLPKQYWDSVTSETVDVGPYLVIIKKGTPEAKAIEIRTKAAELKNAWDKNWPNASRFMETSIAKDKTGMATRPKRMDIATRSEKDSVQVVDIHGIGHGDRKYTSPHPELDKLLADAEATQKPNPQSPKPITESVKETPAAATPKDGIFEKHRASLDSHPNRNNPRVYVPGKSAWEVTKDEWVGLQPEAYQERAALGHESAVKQALKEGKPVPAEVLKDYPDLAPKTAPPKVSGKPNYARGNGEKYPVEWKIKELDDLNASHNHNDFSSNPNWNGIGQPRDRSRVEGKLQVKAMAQALDAEQLLESSNQVVHGSPIVDAKGNVEHGNGRTMAIKLASESHPEQYEAYRKALIAEHPEAANFQKPVLVRERIPGDTAWDDAQIEKYTKIGTSGEGKGLSAAEVARSDAKGLPEHYWDNFEHSGDNFIDSVNSPANHEKVVQFIKRQSGGDQSVMLTASGEFSTEGAKRIERAALFHLMGEGGMKNAEKILENGEIGARIMGGLKQSLLPLLKVKTDRLSDIVNGALTEYTKFKEGKFKNNFEEYMAQGRMDAVDPDAIQLLKELQAAAGQGGSQAKVAEVFKNLAENPAIKKEHSSINQDALFQRQIDTELWDKTLREAEAKGANLDNAFAGFGYTDAEKKYLLAHAGVKHILKAEPTVTESLFGGDTLFQGKTNTKGQYVYDAATKTGVVTLFKNADITTVLHETAHHYLHYMPENELQAFAKSLGITSGKPLNEMSKEDYHNVQEHFARGLESAIHGGTMKDANPQVQAMFDRAAKRFHDIYGEAGVPAPSKFKGGELEQANPQTKTPEFKKWFGESKVVDEKGEPLVVYHGTTSGFDKFNPRKSFGNLGAVFLSEDGAFATSHDYAATDRGGRGVPLYVKLENPFDATNKSHIEKVIAKAESLIGDKTWDTMQGFIPTRKYVEKAMGGGKDFYSLERPDVFRWIKSAGFDGVIVTENGVKNYAVFNPKNLKSAIANSGKFDPKNPSILHQPESSEGGFKLPPEAADIFARMMNGEVTPEMARAPRNPEAPKGEYGISNHSMEDSKNIQAPKGIGKSTAELASMTDEAAKSMTHETAIAHGRAVASGELPLSAENVAKSNAGLGILEGRVDKAAEVLDKASPGSVEWEHAKADLDLAQSQLQGYADDVQKGKSEWANIGRAYQQKVDATGSFARMTETIRRDQGGKPLTEAQTKQIKDIEARHKEATTEIERLTKELDKARAESAVTRMTRTRNKSTDMTQRKGDAIKRIKELLGEDTSSDSLAGRILNQDPSEMDIEAAIRDLAISHVHEGARGLDEVVARIQKDLPKLDDQTIIDAIGQKGTPHTRNEVQKAIADLKVSARRESSEVKRLQGEKEAKKPIERLKAINAKIAEYEKRIADKDFAPTVKTEVEKSKELMNAEGKRSFTSRRFQSMRSVAQKPGNPLMNAAKEVTGLFRYATLGADLGVMLRQGQHAITNPKVYGQGLKNMFQAMGSEERFHGVMQELDSKQIDGLDMVPIRSKSGLSTTDAAFGHEEGFTGTLIKKAFGLVGLSNQAGMLERAQTAFLHTVRTGMFDGFYAAGKMTPIELKNRAELINSLTGRSNIKQVPEFLQVIMTSPRYKKSRYEILARPFKDALPAMKGDRGAQANLRQMAAHTASMAVILYSANQILKARNKNDGVTIDPYSSDFLKVRVGGRAYDLTAGMSPVIRNLYRMTFATFKENDPGYAAKDLAKSALSTISPGITAPIEMKTGRSLQGFEDDSGIHPAWHMAPLIVQQAVKNVKQKQGWAIIAADVFADFVGFSAQSYPKKEAVRPGVKAKGAKPSARKKGARRARS